MARQASLNALIIHGEAYKGGYLQSLGSEAEIWVLLFACTFEHRSGKTRLRSPLAWRIEQMQERARRR